jgi:hypothetical protein
MSLAADDVPTVVLPKIVRFIVNALTNQPELQSLLHVAGFELPEADEMIWDHLGPIFDVLCAYFKRGADKGTVRPIEPALAVLSLLGTVSVDQGLRERFTRRASTGSDTEQVIGEYVSMCLDGLRPISKSKLDSTDCPPLFESSLI